MLQAIRPNDKNMMHQKFRGNSTSKYFYESGLKEELAKGLKLAEVTNEQRKRTKMRRDN